MNQLYPYVVDASVFVARANPKEPFHHDSLALLQSIALYNRQIYVPAITLAEVVASIARNTGRLPLALRYITLFHQMAQVEITEIDRAFGDLAAEIAARQRIRGCDAVYVALAEIKGAVLITLDQEQKTRTPSHIIVRTPGEELPFLLPPSPTT